MRKNSLFYPRVLYILAALAWYLLLWPNPITVFMAGCTACLTLPIYRKLRTIARQRRRNVEPRCRALLAKEIGGPILLRPIVRRWRRIRTGTRLSIIRGMPMTAYLSLIIMGMILPVTLFTVLVAPQVGAGFSRLHELWSNNFQLPEEWTQFLNERFANIHSVPFVNRILEEGQSILDQISEYFSNFSTDTMTTIINRGFNVLGGTMSVLWDLFLFLFLTVIFALYAERIHLVTARIFHLHPLVLHRFIEAIRNALRGIFMGIIFVAIIQGFLCGVGFAIVGYKQFAFWGLLASFVAPIPTVGTALVWGPLSLQLWFSGQTVEAVTLVLWGVIIVSTADSLLRPLFLKKSIKASYFILILVMLCGIAAFGTVGLILGPVLLAFSIQALEEANRAYPSFFTGLQEKKDSPKSTSQVPRS